MNNNYISTAAITDSEGAVVWRAEYMPFGDVIDSTVESVGDHQDRRRLTGHYYDPEMDIDDPSGDERDSSMLYLSEAFNSLLHFGRRKMKRHVLIPLISLMVLLSSNLGLAETPAKPDPYLEAEGFQFGRVYDTDFPNEHVDPFSEVEVRS